MNIEEFIKRKRLMEVEIKNAIIHEIENFHRDTGYRPSGIKVDVTDTTTIGQRKKFYVVTNVITDITF